MSDSCIYWSCRLVSRKAGGCLTFLLHSTECLTETRRKEKERREREQTKSVLRPSLFALKGGREKREREEKTPMFE